MFEKFTDKFADYTMSHTNYINEIITDEDNYNLDKYLLNDILKLLEKSILNKLSSDLLFQKNYWSWGFVTIYYSNFYMAQALNKISGNFYMYKNNRFNKLITYDRDTGLYCVPTENNGETAHIREFKRLKDNFSYIKTWKDEKINELLSHFSISNKDILFKYTIDNEIKESEIRNEINYRLKNYNEIILDSKKQDCRKKIYNLLLTTYRCNCNKFKNFELVKINHYRMIFLSILIQEIKNHNPAFKTKIVRLKEKLNIKYNQEFHDVNENVIKNIERLLR